MNLRKPATFVRKPLMFFSFLAALMLLQSPSQAQSSKKPLRILLVTGGCCHNYPFQTEAMKNALAKTTTAEWTVVNEGGTGTTATIALYDDPRWAASYDVVVHNECFADTKEPAYLKKITSAHFAGVPAVVIHCAIHSYRSADVDDWRQFLGVTSRRHDHQSRYPVKKTVKHYITKKLPADWTGPKDELYIIEKVWPATKVLATSVSERDKKEHPVIWTNKYGKARVFGTTFGHSDGMFSDPDFLTMLSRGIIWAAGRD
ncbi:ThuA domain-containing protein [Pedobacter sp. SYSU D00535]|uniref:ThuA domain-containing protein n=1 Tax=Pedobacter sp. SYSU D00535 TaxID=2810308 RepID=UPI001A95D84B|nr:ThuA domain-containing protein [Pedobacter sp. SYSU D00535]